MKPSEFLKDYECKEIEKVNNLDDWIKVTCKELDKRFIDREEFNNKLEQLKKKPQKVSSFSQDKPDYIKDETEFLKEILERWDNSLEMMSGVDGVIYSKIQNRIEKIEEIKC